MKLRLVAGVLALAAGWVGLTGLGGLGGAGWSLPGWLAQAAPLPAVGSVEVLFTPWDDAEGAILRALGKARRTVHVQAYLLTSRPIAEALLAAAARGVKVEILADGDMMTKGGKTNKTQLPQLAQAGIPLWLETRYAAAHNKIILIDAAEAAPVVITGSYNFSFSAQARNSENLLILREHPALAKRYLDNWQRHRAEAERWTPGVHIAR